MSSDSGELPNDWKTARVTPTFKKSAKTKAGNYRYRPVSLACVPCKVLESIIKEHMQKFAEDMKIFEDSQHGFMQGKSCLTNLLTTLKLRHHQLLR